MKLSNVCLAAALLSVALPAAPVLAASSAASSASEGVSTSVGSLSTSIETSSTSSTGGKKVAQGEYRIIEMAALPERPEFTRVKLAGDAGEFVLTLPRETAEKAQLAQGQRIQAQEKPYGLAFARAEAKEPFFLVMDDEWHRELKSRPVSV